MGLRRRTRLAAGLAALVVAGTTLAGCGSGIPTDASKKDFCAAGAKFAAANELAAGVKAARTLRDTGTPKGIPADARKGFELVISLVTGSKTSAELQRRYEKLTDAQKKSVASLDAYIKKTC